MKVGKTKVMQRRVSRVQSEDSGKHLCGVCRKGVASNSIFSVECLRWIHERDVVASRRSKEAMLNSTAGDYYYYYNFTW